MLCTTMACRSGCSAASRETWSGRRRPDSAGGGYFGRIVGANDGTADKPAPDAVILALDGTGISPGPDVWYVGDTGIDVTCARNAGCTAVIVSADPPRDGNCPRVPDHQFSDHAGLHGFLREKGITI